MRKKIFQLTRTAAPFVAAFLVLMAMTEGPVASAPAADQPYDQLTSEEFEDAMRANLQALGSHLWELEPQIAAFTGPERLQMARLSTQLQHVRRQLTAALQDFEIAEPERQVELRRLIGAEFKDTLEMHRQLQQLITASRQAA